jgi:hypothetical protein
MVKEMQWKGRTLSTYGDLINAVTGCRSPQEAQEFLLAYQAINPHARDNIGYMIGDVDRDVGRRIIEWFGCEHPIFGTTFPTAQEAFEAGMKLGETMRLHGVEAAKKLLKRRNPNPWFVGALEDE